MLKSNLQSSDNTGKSNTLFQFSKETGLVSVNFANPGTRHGRLINSFLRPTLGLVNINWIQSIFSKIANDNRPDKFIYHKILDAFGIQFEFNRKSLIDIPNEGPLFIISNHPLFMMDGYAIMSAVTSIRDDIKFLGISHLKVLPGISGRLIPVKTGRSERAKRRNQRTKKASIEWLRDGHTLFACPAGDFSYRKSASDPYATDPRWHKGVAEIIRASRATVLPAFVHGEMSRAFQKAQRIHTVLTLFLSLRELRLSENTTINFEIGRPIPFGELETIGNDITLIEYLRDITYSMRPPFPGRLHGQKTSEQIHKMI